MNDNGYNKYLMGRRTNSTINYLPILNSTIEIPWLEVFSLGDRYKEKDFLCLGYNYPNVEIRLLVTRCHIIPMSH